jgi:hypothetical protein
MIIRDRHCPNSTEMSSNSENGVPHGIPSGPYTSKTKFLATPSNRDFKSSTTRGPFDA